MAVQDSVSGGQGKSCPADSRGVGAGSLGKKKGGRQKAVLYRLALDLGSGSIGWAVIRLRRQDNGKLVPCGIIRAGVRIFHGGRDPKTGRTLCSLRTEFRLRRRNRARTVRRGKKLGNDLARLGLNPANIEDRRALGKLDPYELRSRGLDQKLEPFELGRAIFHLSKHRGFKGRRSDEADSETGVIKSAIARTKAQMRLAGARTLGEYLHQMLQKRREKVEARRKLLKDFRRLPPEQRALQQESVAQKASDLEEQARRIRIRSRLAVVVEGGKAKKAYALFPDRELVVEEFNALWEAQRRFYPKKLTPEAHARIADTIFFQRKRRSGENVGRCTLMPTLERAPIALPSQQELRIYLEVNPQFQPLYDSIRRKPQKAPATS